ncbi:MAG: hypothetical protein AAGK78_03540, partial [Planctomycetota bacterium]
MTSATDEITQLRAAGESLGVPFVGDLSKLVPSPEFVDRVPIGFARERAMMAFLGKGDRLTIALGSDASWESFDAVTRLLNHPADPVFAPPAEVIRA